MQAVPSTSRAIHTCARAFAVPTRNSSLPGPRTSFAKVSKAGASVSADDSTSKSHAVGIPGNVSVAHLPILNPANMSIAEVGNAFVYSDTFTKSVVNTDLPKALRNDLAFTRQPTTILRYDAVELLKSLRPDAKLRRLLVGKSGSGRSTILMQTIAYCKASDWLVLYIPDAHKLVDGTYSYALGESGQKVYEQRDLARLILRKFIDCNGSLMKKLDGDVQQSVKEGASDSSAAMKGFHALLQSHDTPNSPPLLVAIDAVEALTKPSLYLSNQAGLLHPTRLSVPNLLLSYISGQQILSKGALVAATDEPGGVLPKNVQMQIGPLSLQEAAGIYRHLSEISLLTAEGLSDSAFMEAFVGSDGNAQLFTRGLRAIHGGTARGVVKKGRRRGIALRADTLLTVTV
ncbi:MAG: 37S ribosomal protein S23 mitochondrial [Cyphobasidiales sp. Tagirdzhanova-0007]|nr:MAG: 37S ribosomal protein S23 mitochondrial [Cyphobasidiales sp. Tagirdzhanova-0007]